MSSNQTPFVTRWGIIGCGWISSEFVKGLSLIREDVTDISHSITAVGSRDKSKADAFIKEHTPKGANGQQLGHVKTLPEGYGSYDEVFNHPDVDIIYIGTPNTSHYPDALKALEANKHVLLEKPATLNVREWRELRREAEGRGVFIMEAVWTRFLPVAYDLQEELFVKKSIGEVKMVHADFSMSFQDFFPDTHRTLSPTYAGGPLLDLGPYIILIAILALYHNPDNQKEKPKVEGRCLMSRTGCDLTSFVGMRFERLGAGASLTTSFAYNGPADVPARIIGTKGEILIHGPGLSQLKKITIRTLDQDPGPMASKWKEDRVIERDFEGFGLHFEADAVGRSLKAGELENKRMPHDETDMVMEIFDQIRLANGYRLPTDDQ